MLAPAPADMIPGYAGAFELWRPAVREGMLWDLGVVSSGLAGSARRPDRIADWRRGIKLASGK